MKLTKDQIEQIPYYYQKGFSSLEIARHYNIRHQSVFYYLKKFGIRRRYRMTNKQILEMFKRFK